MKWFHVINTAGEPLNEQELRNSAYTGTWLSDAKQRFSTKTGRGVVLADGIRITIKAEPLLNGNWNDKSIYKLLSNGLHKMIMTIEQIQSKIIC